MTQPKISIVVYDGSFRERFFQVDSLVNQTIDNNLFEYIFVENFNKVNPKLKDKLDDISLTYKLITLNKNKSYHLGKCVNEGVRQSQGDIVIVSDADTYWEPNVLEKTLNYHSSNFDSVLYVHRYDEPRPPLLRNADKITLPKLQSRCELLNPNNYGGFMSVSRENYVKSGGYSQHPIWSGYSSAGAMDLKIRFENMGLKCEWSDNLKIYHVCHENAFDNNRWNGFRVESQWKLIDKRKNNDTYKPLIGIAENGYGTKRFYELGEWWEKWLGNFDDKSIGYKPKL